MEELEKEFLDSDVNSINESDDSDSNYESEKVSSVESDKLSIDDSDFNVTDTTYTSVPAISHSESRDLNNLKEMWRQIFEKKEENVHSQSRDLDNLVKDAESFYLEVEQHFKNSKFFFIPVTKIQDITEKMKISERFQLAKRITNTLRLHHYEAIDGVYTHLKVKEISTQDTFRTAATTIGYSDY